MLPEERDEAVDLSRVETLQLIRRVQPPAGHIGTQLVHHRVVELLVDSSGGHARRDTLLNAPVIIQRYGAVDNGLRLRHRIERLQQVLRMRIRQERLIWRVVLLHERGANRLGAEVVEPPGGDHLGIDRLFLCFAVEHGVVGKYRFGNGGCKLRLVAVVVVKNHDVRVLALQRLANRRERLRFERIIRVQKHAKLALRSCNPRTARADESLV
ncbi:hypothetical protein SDC9_170157 [bioreactor metagenome]|uniref:Uncharacterized protein n=1 Tax=bioreactor metagenome TaxID=1076179 RepID=A0A645GGA4_9ZZZZ